MPKRKTLLYYDVFCGGEAALVIGVIASSKREVRRKLATRDPRQWYSIDIVGDIKVPPKSIAGIERGRGIVKRAPRSNATTRISVL